MHRVDTAGHIDNAFADGDPQIGQQGTVIDEVWLNDLQENICRLIEDAGVVLDKGVDTQLKEAVQAMIDAATSGGVAAEAAIRLAADNALDVRLDAIEDALDEQATVGSGHWMKHPCGVIEQWGVYAGGASNPAIVFPIEFPGACEGVQITPIGFGATSTNSEATSVHHATLAGAPTAAGFSAWCSFEDTTPDQFTAATTTAFHWRAIGR